MNSGPLSLWERMSAAGGQVRVRCGASGVERSAAIKRCSATEQRGPPSSGLRPPSPEGRRMSSGLLSLWERMSAEGGQVRVRCGTSGVECSAAIKRCSATEQRGPPSSGLRPPSPEGRRIVCEHASVSLRQASREIEVHVLAAAFVGEKLQEVRARGLRALSELDAMNRRVVVALPDAQHLPR